MPWRHVRSLTRPSQRALSAPYPWQPTVVRRRDHVRRYSAQDAADPAHASFDQQVPSKAELVSPWSGGHKGSSSHEIESGSTYTQATQNVIKSIYEYKGKTSKPDEAVKAPSKPKGGRKRNIKPAIRPPANSKTATITKKKALVSPVKDDGARNPAKAQVTVRKVRGGALNPPSESEGKELYTKTVNISARRRRTFRKLAVNPAPDLETGAKFPISKSLAQSGRRRRNQRQAEKRISAKKRKDQPYRLSKTRSLRVRKLIARDGKQKKIGNISPAERKRPERIMESTVQIVDALKLNLTPISVHRPPVPSLACGLDRVLFNPGVHHLQDPRSRVYNFDPYLQNIMPVNEFDFDALKKYITSSEDTTLREIAQQYHKKYVGSTSSMTGMLAHFHYLISQWRPVNLSMLSRGFPVQSEKFTEFLRSPSVIFLRYQDGAYAIDVDKEFDKGNVLALLGKSMEKFLCLEPEEYERYRKSNSAGISEEEKTAPESYHYSTSGDFLMRSQLDAYDSRLPGTGMFDLKTRAVVSIRMDVSNHEQGVGYEIKELFGEWESYEREYYDMIRAAFLKYSLQVRMGRMDGIFVAHHNIERVFGFQYVGIDEMDLALHGQKDTTLGDREFLLSIDLLNKVLDRATERFPKTSIRLHFETRETATPFMYIFAEPFTEDQVNELQSKQRAAIDKFERNALGIPGSDSSDPTLSESQWEDMEASVQDTMDRDEKGIEEELANPSKPLAESQNASPAGKTEIVDGASRLAGPDGTVIVSEKNSNIVSTLPSDVETNDSFETDADRPFLDKIKQEKAPPGQVLAMTLTIRNKVNDEYVTRPDSMRPGDKWKVEYSLVERTDAEKAWALYLACKARRAKKVTGQPDTNAEKISFYLKSLRRMTAEGRKWRRSMDKMDENRPLHILGKV